MDPEVISRLMEIADCDSRLEHLVEVLRRGKASVSEREEWIRYCNSLSSSARLLESEQVEMHTAPVVAPHKPPKVTPNLSQTQYSVQPSNVTSIQSSVTVGEKLSPPYSLTGHQHHRTPTQCLQEDEVVFLHERPRTPAKQAGALHGALNTNSPLFVSPTRPLVVENSCILPVADPFAQAKRKRAQAVAELRERQKTSEIIDTEEVKVVGRPVVPTTTSSVRKESASPQTLSVKIRSLESSIAGYQAASQQKNIKLQYLGAEVDRERSRHRRSLRESKQQLTDLKIKLEESQRAARMAQIKYREQILKMERMLGPVTDNASTTACKMQDDTNIELANLRSEVSALRSLIAAKDKPSPICDFAHRNLFSAPQVLRETVRTILRGPGRQPKTTSSFAESYAGANLSEDNEEHTDKEEDINLTRNERALRAFDEAIGLPQNPIPVRVDGMLAYRDGTRDSNGRLPRAKNLFKVGRNVPGELK
ncbi:hypothetical protein MMC32_002144 [Xylographa parallela]|nr:hypothetical protein [Xylographa parallela]